MSGIVRLILKGRIVRHFNKTRTGDTLSEDFYLHRTAQAEKRRSSLQNARNGI